MQTFQIDQIKRRGRYGVDAPLVLAGSVLGSAAAIALTLIVLSMGRIVLGFVVFAVAFYVSASTVAFAYTTLRGKFEVWADELGRLGLSGAERVLDMGCGRGAVLTTAARLVPLGKVTGVDLWRRQDQSGNGLTATEVNVATEGFADRVEVVTGDMRSLPFHDASFDVVVSSLAVHNIGDDDGRSQAIAEAFRVVKPGGRVLIADMSYVDRYAATLRQLGAEDVTVYGLGWRFWYGGPYFTRMVRARKPA